MSDARPAGDPVAALAAEVARLEREVQALAEASTGRDESVKGLSRQLSSMTERLERLVEREEVDNPAAWWWPSTRKREAEERWPDLIEWVDEAIYSRHPAHGRVLRPCWFRHTDVVDQLTALYVAWQWAYDSPGSLPTAAAEWQLRYLPDTMNRVKATLQTCVKAHVDPNDPLRPSSADISAFITDDAAKRAD